MSLEGQVDCQRMLIGPWAFAIIGKPSVAAPAVAAAAPAKNLRRETAWGFLICSLLIESSIGKRLDSWLSRRYCSWYRELIRVNIHGSVFFRRRPSECHDAKARESYSYTAAKSSRFRDLPHCKSSAARGSRRTRAVRNGPGLVGRIGMPAHDDQQGEKAEHVGKAHVPAVIEPAPDRLRFRKHVGECNACARAEPDH